MDNAAPKKISAPFFSVCLQVQTIGREPASQRAQPDRRASAMRYVWPLCYLLSAYHITDAWCDRCYDRSFPKMLNILMDLENRIYCPGPPRNISPRLIRYYTLLTGYVLLIHIHTAFKKGLRNGESKFFSTKQASNSLFLRSPSGPAGLSSCHWASAIWPVWVSQFDARRRAVLADCSIPDIKTYWSSMLKSHRHDTGTSRTTGGPCRVRRSVGSGLVGYWSFIDVK